MKNIGNTLIWMAKNYRKEDKILNFPGSPLRYEN